MMMMRDLSRFAYRPEGENEFWGEYLVSRSESLHGPLENRIDWLTSAVLPDGRCLRGSPVRLLPAAEARKRWELSSMDVLAWIDLLERASAIGICFAPGTLVVNLYVRPSPLQVETILDYVPAVESLIVKYYDRSDFLNNPTVEQARSLIDELIWD